jgi:uncharacterized protein
MGIKKRKKHGQPKQPSSKVPQKMQDTGAIINAVLHRELQGRPGETMPFSTGQSGYHLMAKPAGPRCNLRCEYCFYIEKEALFSGSPEYRMTDQVLEAYVKKYIETQPVNEVPFVWQGGEPTLMGLDFFKKAIELQRKYGKGKHITNSLQTNGTLLDDQWCEFLARNSFLVGFSLDGPEDIHDLHRLYRGGRPTWTRVMQSLRLLQKHGVQYNVLACVTRESSKTPLAVYHFLRDQGVQFMQFIPIVERIPDGASVELGLLLASPPVSGQEELQTEVTPWTVEPEAFGDFLIAVFQEWVRHDVGKFFVMNFEWSLASWCTFPATICTFTTRCGTSMILEHNGDIYSCDHFVYPRYRLGNIVKDNPLTLLHSMEQSGFGAAKESSLPWICRDCEVLFACRGECPKHRFMTTPDGEPGLNYLCAGYKKFFRFADPYMRNMIKLLEHDLPVEKIMEAIDAPLIIRLDA